MDNLLYISMTGAKENFNALAVRANNLANASTIGFKADYEQARAMQAYGEGLPSRVFSLTERPGHDMSHGAITVTNRDLDVAIKGDGFIAVLDRDGKEAYTRAGSLRIDDEGILRTENGLRVAGMGGEEISIPMPAQKVFINADGTVAGVPEGENSSTIEEFSQIKLVNPEIRSLVKGRDGLFRRTDGMPALEDPTVQLEGGMLEMSNVNVAAEMTNLIRLQRQFDANVKLMKTAEDIDQSANNLLRLS